MTTTPKNNEQPQGNIGRAGGLAVRTNLRAGTSQAEIMEQIKAFFQQLMNAQSDTTTTAATTDTTTTV